MLFVTYKIDSKRENATFLSEKETEKTSNFDFRVEKSAERDIINAVFIVAGGKPRRPVSPQFYGGA
ncbi:MAG: hypothetical protein J6Y92_07065 [Lentisphaeria bacterium]|nr:hypothetical protein [Lentisphaeria bacterium]